MRKCILCSEEITLCMGSVLARDWIAAEQGRIEWRQVREHCGKCVGTMILISDHMQAPRLKMLVQSYLHNLPEPPPAAKGEQ